MNIYAIDSINRNRAEEYIKKIDKAVPIFWIDQALKYYLDNN